MAAVESPEAVRHDRQPVSIELLDKEGGNRGYSFDMELIRDGKFIFPTINDLAEAKDEIKRQSDENPKQLYRFTIHHDPDENDMRDTFIFAVSAGDMYDFDDDGTKL